VSVYAGRSASERKAQRRERLLEAGLELAGTGGGAALTVRGACEHAGLTARYFYESFSDREALLIAVFDQIAGEAAVSVLAAVGAAGETAEEKARAAIAAFVELVAEDPRKARVLFVEAPDSAALMERRLATVRVFADLVAGQGRDFYEVTAGEDALVATTATMLAGGLAQTLLSWLDGTLQSTREELVEHCALLFVATGEAAVAVARGRR
jgi:AcrR family transcriptional regulator